MSVTPSSRWIYCAVCKEADVSLSVPYDQVGMALMEQHLLSDHGVKLGFDDEAELNEFPGSR